MSVRINLENISIVLQKPRIPENIGATARAAKNMGITKILVVEPENFDRDRILKMSTHSAADVVDGIQVFDELKEALEPYQYIVGTTARLGGQRVIYKSPSAMAKALIPISAENRVAVVFGPEDRGLSNEDIRYCHMLVNIPTADFASLNLAQAVMVICYEIFTAEIEEHVNFIPRLAERHELEGMYDQLQEILVRIGFINAQNPEYWLNNLRKFFDRLPLRAREVRIIRGICRQMDWYANKCYQDGLKQNERGNSDP